MHALKLRTLSLHLRTPYSQIWGFRVGWRQRRSLAGHCQADLPRNDDPQTGLLAIPIPGYSPAGSPPDEVELLLKITPETESRTIPITVTRAIRTTGNTFKVQPLPVGTYLTTGIEHTSTNGRFEFEWIERGDIPKEVFATKFFIEPNTVTVYPFYLGSLGVGSRFSTDDIEGFLQKISEFTNADQWRLTTPDGGNAE